MDAFESALVTRVNITDVNSDATLLKIIFTFF